jgi:isopentenyl phosphate kinase
MLDMMHHALVLYLKRECTIEFDVEDFLKLTTSHDQLDHFNGVTYDYKLMVDTYTQLKLTMNLVYGLRFQVQRHLNQYGYGKIEDPAFMQGKGQKRWLIVVEQDVKDELNPVMLGGIDPDDLDMDGA